MSFRRKKLAINYCSKLYLQTSHPAHRYVFKPKLSRAFQQKPNATKPLSERVSSIIQQLKLIIINPIENHTPPWTYVKPKVNLHLSTLGKDITPSDLRSQFQKLIDTLPDHKLFYTDGSKSDLATSSAFVTNDSTHKMKLNHLSSIYSAEVNAIAMALDYSSTLPDRKIVIASDSLSALKALNNMYSNHPGIQRILEIGTKMKDDQKIVQYIWVPGHVGIKGNEMADKAAKEALFLPGRGKVLLTSSELARPLKENIQKEWQDMWDKTLSKLKTIKTDIRPWNSSSRDNRREEVVLARIRIGHTRLTHLHLITKEPPPRCQHCGNTLTIAHILQQCPYYSRKLDQMGISRNTAISLGNNSDAIDKLISFLNNVNLLKDL